MLTKRLMILCCFLTALYACTSDQLVDPNIPVDVCADPVTYDGQIEAIITTYCALSGCHVSGGDGPGDYSTYEGMSPFLNAASFENVVVDLKDDPISGMPPDWDANPGPKDLTDEDFDLVKCWIEQSYPEN